MTRSPMEWEILANSRLEEITEARKTRVGRQPLQAVPHPVLARLRRGMGNTLIAVGERVAGHKAGSAQPGSGHATIVRLAR